MIPGLTTKISEQALSLATTIAPQSDLVRVTSTATTTVLAQITPPYGGSPGVMLLSNESGAAITTVTTGNIVTAVTIPSNGLVVFAYSALRDKYIVGATN